MSMRMARMIALAVLVAMFGTSAYFLGDLPDGARIATHFDIGGLPDGWSGRWGAALVMPMACLLTSALIMLLPSIDPRREGILRSIPALTACWMATLILFATAHAAILLNALGRPVDIGRLITFPVGLLFMVTGNYFGKIRWNYTFGMRTPWTLASERVWDKTHRFGGRLFFVVGAIMIAAAMLPIDGAMRADAGLLAVAAVMLIVIKSYLLWREEARVP